VTAAARYRLADGPELPGPARGLDYDDLSASFGIVPPRGVAPEDLVWRDAVVRVAALRASFTTRGGRLSPRHRYPWREADHALAQRFADLYVLGEVRDPVTLAATPSRMVVFDGCHRVAGAIMAGLDEIRATLCEGWSDDGPQR
jgi:hypothetical protein